MVQLLMMARARKIQRLGPALFRREALLIADC